MADRFTSIAYPIAIDAGFGRLAEETDYAEHVDDLVRQVLLTAPGERINRPDFGCGIKRMVFAPNSNVVASLTKVAIYEALNRWLSSVIVVADVRVQAVDERLDIHLIYTLRARQERRYLNLQVTI